MGIHLRKEDIDSTKDNKKNVKIEFDEDVAGKLNFSKSHLNIIVGRDFPLDTMKILEDIGFELVEKGYPWFELSGVDDLLQFSYKYSKLELEKNLKIFDEERKIRNQKKITPWNLHQVFVENFKTTFPQGTVAIHPSQKELAKWKLLVKRYGSDKVEELISYTFQNFEFLNKKFKWSGVNVNVLCGWADSIFAYKDGFAINEFSRTERAGDKESYEENKFDW